MKFQLEYIKNPPTADDLIELYESNLYEKLITEFSQKTNVTLVGEFDKQLIRQVTIKHYLVLNLPIEKIITELKNSKSKFLNFCVERSNFYTNRTDKNFDGEFSEGEELSEEEKSEIVEEHGTSKSFLLENFCEFYLLKLENNKRLLHFLKATRMPFAKKHLSEISKIYKIAATKK